MRTQKMQTWVEGEQAVMQQLVVGVLGVLELPRV
jgi:hypothetical protein